MQHIFEEQYEQKFEETYPDLLIESGDCQGECERGPIVRVNDSIVLREVDEQMAEKLMNDPESLLGEVMHVLEQDRETFDRIIQGDLF